MLAGGKHLLRAAGLPHVAEGVEVETHSLELAADGLYEALGPSLCAREDPEPRVRMAGARAAAAGERLRRGTATDGGIALGLVVHIDPVLSGERLGQKTLAHGELARGRTAKYAAFKGKRTDQGIEWEDGNVWPKGQHKHQD